VVAARKGGGLRIRTAKRDAELAAWLEKDPDPQQLIGLLIVFCEECGFPESAEALGRRVTGA